MDRIPLELFLWAELLKQYGCHCAFATWIQWCAHRRHMSYHWPRPQKKKEINSDKISSWPRKKAFNIKLWTIKDHDHAHCSYLDISRKIRLCAVDLEGKFQTKLQAKSSLFSVNSDLLYSKLLYRWCDLKLHKMIWWLYFLLKYSKNSTNVSE